MAGPPGSRSVSPGPRRRQRRPRAVPAALQLRLLPDWRWSMRAPAASVHPARQGQRVLPALRRPQHEPEAALWAVLHTDRSYLRQFGFQLALVPSPRSRQRFCGSGRAGAGPCAAVHRPAAGSRSARARRRPSRCGPRPPIPAGTRNRIPGSRPGGRWRTWSRPPSSRPPRGPRPKRVPPARWALQPRWRRRSCAARRGAAGRHAATRAPAQQPGTADTSRICSEHDASPARARVSRGPGRDALEAGLPARHGPVVGRDPLCTPR